jgi:hypothetical protein
MNWPVSTEIDWPQTLEGIDPAFTGCHRTGEGYVELQNCGWY